jgi:hypothetical protein
VVETVGGGGASNASSLNKSFVGCHVVGRPPAALAAFGFGGRIVLMHPVQKQHLVPVLASAEDLARYAGAYFLFYYFSYP